MERVRVRGAAPRLAQALPLAQPPSWSVMQPERIPPGSGGCILPVPSALLLRAHPEGGRRIGGGRGGARRRSHFPLLPIPARSISVTFFGGSTVSFFAMRKLFSSWRLAKPVIMECVQRHTALTLLVYRSGVSKGLSTGLERFRLFNGKSFHLEDNTLQLFLTHPFADTYQGKTFKRELERGSKRCQFICGNTVVTYSAGQATYNIKQYDTESNPSNPLEITKDEEVEKDNLIDALITSQQCDERQSRKLMYLLFSDERANLATKLSSGKDELNAISSKFKEYLKFREPVKIPLIGTYGVKTTLEVKNIQDAILMCERYSQETDAMQTSSSTYNSVSPLEDLLGNVTKVSESLSALAQKSASIPRLHAREGEDRGGGDGGES